MSDISVNGSGHQGISRDAVQAAWDECGSIGGVARELGCSRTNARRRLEVIRVVTPPASRARRPALTAVWTEHELVAHVVASQLTDDS